MYNYDKNWSKVDLNKVPDIKVTPPGPKSQAIEKRASKHMRGYSSQARLFPVAFESGKGVTLRDVDGNTYIDFSGGIYVTNFGHCHPKITEAVVKQTRKLQNCHDFNTEIKTKLIEKLTEITPGDLNGVQLWSNGSKAVEAGMNIARAATGKHEFISFHNGFHGKTLGAQSLTHMNRIQGIRAAGCYRVPYGNCYRCSFKLEHPSCGIQCVEYIREVIEQQTTQQVAAIVLEPIQGWGGAVFPPDLFFSHLRKLCADYGILLFADEILTCMGRTGTNFCVEHWGDLPDIMTIGKGLGNGFPVCATVFSDKYKDVMKDVSASSSYGGNPVACAAALASIEVLLEEGLLEHVVELGQFILGKLRKIKEEHKIIGDVRGKGCLLGMEVVKDLDTREPFVEAGNMIYQKAFRKGLAWIPAKQNLRMSPSLIMTKEVANKALDIIEEAITETEHELGY